MLTVYYELEREPYDEATEEYGYELTMLRIEGDYHPGEAASWGYYGGCPGSASEGEIMEMVPLGEGESLATRTVTWKNWKGEMETREVKEPHENLNGITYRFRKWEGELTASEEEAIREKLCEAGEEAIGDAKVDAYLDSLDY